MKSLSGLILAVVLASVSCFSHAIQISDENLTEAQKHQLEELAAKLKVENATNKANGIDPLTSAKKVDEWVGVGEHVGKALGGAAKELGIAINDFMQSPAGKLVVVVILFKLFGSLVVHVLGGLTALAIGGTLIYVLLRYGRQIDTVYDTDKKTWWGGKVVKSVTSKEMKDDYVWAIVITAVITTLVFLLTTFTY